MTIANNNYVVWLTGLSGSGKSTLAEKVYLYLKDQGLRVERLDGDVVRSQFPQTGFSKKDRNDHIRRVGSMASSLERQGVIVVASFISPYKEAREEVRRACKNFIEVYVDTPLQECERRDPKGLYKKVRSGQISHFTGVDDPYEIPEAPEIIIKTQGRTVEESFKELILAIEAIVLKK